MILFLGVTFLALLLGDDPFVIRVVDQDTGRGVPLVELRTTGHIRVYSDSAGVVAFDEPGLLGKRVFFHISSHGYEYPKDGFGYRGVSLETVPDPTPSSGEVVLRVHACAPDQFDVTIRAGRAGSA